MGSRGSRSGVSDKGTTYGKEYKTLFTVDNIKFVQPTKPGSTPVPLETMSAGKNRVYALVNNRGVLKSIVFYDKQGKKRRQIDLTHDHDRGNPHVHIGYDIQHDRKHIPLTTSDKAYVAKVTRIWREENGKK